MCGIWASIGFKVDRERIDRVAHRGPDGQGWHDSPSAWGPVALGHRRLAIIDTSDGGAQPMSDSTGRFWLTFNGEIYNYKELRLELTDLGIAFATDSDSEVLLQAYIKWGDSCLSRLFGMFAFAIWDETHKQLFLARDRFGIKPLYYVQNSNGFAAASEIKQVFDLPGVSRRMNRARVYDFLSAGISDHTHETMFDGVFQLRAGECLIIDTRRSIEDQRPQHVRWYSLPRPNSIHPTLTEAAETYRALFDESMKLHLRADVAVGSCLSGGLDSSTIVCATHSLLGHDAFAGHFTAVSAVFDEKRIDERRFMDAVITETGAKSIRTTLNADDIQAMVGDMLWHQDEPFGSTSICAQGAVFRAAAQSGLKVMLDGQGADEALAGYHWLFGPALAQLLRSARLPSAWRMLKARSQVHGISIKAQLKQAAPHILPAAWRASARRFHRARDGADWLDGPALRPFLQQPGPFEIAAHELNIENRTDVGAMCLSLTAATSVPMLLHWEDRSSMMHSIEARVPFLDHRLVEYAIQLGGQHKLIEAETKVVLRRAMADRLPDAVLNRQDKLGFATPEQEWAQGPMRDFVRSGVLKTLDTCPELLNREATLALVDGTLDGRLVFSFTPWRILMVGIWAERFSLAS